MHCKRFPFLSSPARWLLVLLGLVGAWPALAQTKSAKRGVAYGYHSAADMRALAPGLSWWYNWSPGPDAGVTSVYQGLGLDFVPMQWNKDLNGATVTADALAARIPAGAKYLLGFNEPNFRSQANLTPTQAAALWPVLQEVARRKNLKLVSPALNYCGDCVSENGITYYSPTQYLDAFFAACPTCQVDYIAVHTYVCDVRWLRDKIGELKKYNKPIWLTEFSCGDLPHDQITLDGQKKYMTDAVAYLESEPAVFRYSWFAGRNNEIPYINLLGADGQLTALGQLYVGLPYAGSPPPPSPPPAPTPDVRLTPVAVQASSSQGGNPAANAIDQNRATRWASNWTGTEYLQLDFGTPRDISRVKILWESAYAKDYRLETSLDGVTWNTPPLRTVLNSNGGEEDLTGLAGRGRYLRLTGTRRALSSFGYSIYELEVYGPAAAPAAPIQVEAESYSSMSGVQVESCAEGGQDVGYIDAGDRLTYANVRFPAAGSYLIEYRVASPNGGTLRPELDGAALGSPVALPATGGWQNWRTVSQTVTVSAGLHTLALVATTGGWNINWLRLTPPPAAASASSAALLTAANEAAPLRVYPNPVGTTATLTGLTTAPTTVVIYDARGALVRRVELAQPGPAETLNVSGLADGVYFLRATTSTGAVQTQRFVKQ